MGMIPSKKGDGTIPPSSFRKGELGQNKKTASTTT